MGQGTSFLPLHGCFGIAGDLALEMGACFPHVGRFPFLIANVSQVEKGTVGVRQWRMGGTAEVLMNMGELHRLPKISALWISFLLCSLRLGNAALCICSAGAEFVRALWA